MKLYQNVISAQRPDAMTVDDYSVWISSEIRESSDGWIYNLTQYGKDEYIVLMSESSQKAQADIEYLSMMTEVELE